MSLDETLTYGHLINLFIVEGDTTTRGGKVVASEQGARGVRVKDKRRMAFINDEVRYDDKPGQVFRILGNGTPRIDIGGRFVAMEGDLVSDGSRLVASTIQNRDVYIAAVRKDASEWRAASYTSGTRCDQPQFFVFYNYFKKIADKLDTNVDFIMAQSAQESEWGKSNAAKGNNLFGVNRRIDDPRIYRSPVTEKLEGTNAAYYTIEEGIQAWVDKWGEKVRGAKTLDKYLDGLTTANYNINPQKYKEDVKKVYPGVLKRKEQCNIPK